MSDLTEVQQCYVWLIGSYPNLVAKQGRGYRGRPIRYAVDGETLYLFGYSNPIYWLLNRGLVRKMQDASLYELTDAGREVFQRLLVSGFGFKAAKLLRKAKLKA